MREDERRTRLARLRTAMRMWRYYSRQAAAEESNTKLFGGTFALRPELAAQIEKYAAQIATLRTHT